MKVQAIAVAAVLVANLIDLPTAAAASAIRAEIVNAAGVCVPFAPTGQLRNSVGGVRNAGTSTFYVVCSQQADFSEGPTGTGAVTVYVRNTGISDISINCTLRPGYSLDGSTTAGGAHPQSVVVAAGDVNAMSWNSEALGAVGDRFMNPNLTCTVPVNGVISFIYSIYDENIGT